MAKKIIGGVGSLLGLNKKKKKAPEEPAEQKGPIIKPLAANDHRLTKRRGFIRGVSRAVGAPTILSDKLGG